MKKLMPLYLLILLSLFSVSVHPEETRSPKIACCRITSTPVIDGIIAEDLWLKGEMLTQFHQLGQEHRPAKLPSMAVLLYDEKNLYLAMLMARNADDPMRDSIWHDGVEIFIDPGRRYNRYFQIAANPKNKWSAAYCEGSFDMGWRPEMEIAGRQIPGGWLLEMSVPFSSLGLVPKPGDIWGVNICRNDSRVGHITLSPIEKYQDISSFYKMLFEGEREKSALPYTGDSHKVFNDTVKQLEKEISSLPDNIPAKENLVKNLTSFREKAVPVEKEADKNPAFSEVYRGWTYSSLLKGLKDTVYWRIMVIHLFNSNSYE